MDQALDAAINVFWKQGYEGTTLDNLTTAMGISRPSLYAAFGDKEATFKRAVERYSQVDLSYVETSLAQPTALAVAAEYLRGHLRASTNPNRPPGCLTVQGGVSGSQADQRVVKFLDGHRAAVEVRLAARFKQAITDGDLSSEEDPADLARYLLTVTSGQAIQAGAGATRDQLSRVADRALAAFRQAT
ncbi:TetR/AcrR family transcriptional regulator [Promicromonospora sukumoe]|uniref:AcrR family transcriptional regulator n=1 Tax=Promicromonospora sukumoe TaxID=88382 RepID=A0A7W3J7H4_9MICO|nr:TetR/AcrR family transcriptional regulator [Promicromonospora sukumoe]MBA8807715.1 AcrR family transcriptional regulator [Promicromonospora sukumoe]